MIILGRPKIIWDNFPHPQILNVITAAKFLLLINRYEFWELGCGHLGGWVGKAGGIIQPTSVPNILVRLRQCAYCD